MDETRRRRWIIVLTGIGSFMAALDTLVVASALSTIQRDLGASLTDLEWTVNAYNLSLAVLLVPAAVLGDRLGRARTYAAGLALFALTSAGAALAGSVGALVGLRVLQGAAAAVVMTLGLALLSSAFPPERRGAAVGLFSAVTGVAVACGPLVGGAVVEGLAWQWIFWLNVPIGLLAAPLVLRVVPEATVPDSRLDAWGVALLGLGVLGVVWGVVRGEEAGWTSADVLVPAAAGVVLLGGFAAWQRRAPYPLLPPRLLRVRGFAAGNAAVALTVAPLFTAVFFYGQLLQVVMGHDALGAGVRLMAWTGTLLLVAPVAGALGDRIGERPLIVVGLALQAVAMLWLALVVDPGIGFLDALGPFVLGGLGVSLAIPGGQSAAVASVADRDVATAAGVNSTVRQLGGVLGIAATVAVFGATGGFATPDDFVDGFRAAMLTAAGLSALGAVVALTLPARRGNLPDRDEQTDGPVGSGSLEGAAA
ncbi:MFS transporter [Nocardioides halotolerans]|uniref:MFS transporter n=1 Tax=Nocardioides halotolerans TaxID=433660 RepID=UPI00041BB5F0|nr:MFS transporter [Nocardioides halotolerans]